MRVWSRCRNTPSLYIVKHERFTPPGCKPGAPMRCDAAAPAVMAMKNGAGTWLEPWPRTQITEVVCWT